MALKMRKIAAGAAGLAVSLVLVVAPEAQAAAPIWQTGIKQSTTPSFALMGASGFAESYEYGSSRCEATWGFSNSSGVVVLSNDLIYVKDTCRDGRSAVARVVDLNGNTATRICRNPHGFGTWAKCDFNWPEPAQYRFEAGVYNADTGYLRFDFYESCYFNG